MIPAFDPLAERLDFEAFPSALTRRIARAGAGILLLGMIWGDYRTGPEFSFASFYLIPVLLAAWFGGRRDGFYVALASAAVWPVLAIFGVPTGSPWWIILWNGLNRLIVLATLAWLAALANRRRE